MLLAINVGNSNTVLALFRPLAEEITAPAPGSPPPGSGPAPEADEGSSRRFSPEVVAKWRIVTTTARGLDEFGVLLRSLFQASGIAMSEVTGVAIASVVPTLDAMMRQISEVFFKVKPLLIEPGVRTGLPVLTDSPAEVGADRIANCVAAYEQFKGPCIIVDLGTATNFDVVSQRGEFLGGAIAPGLGISAEALFTRAARLPHIEIRKPVKVIGTSTVDNIQSGLYYGYIGLIDGILERILERMTIDVGPKTRIQVIATGGLASLIATETRHIGTIDELLTLTGLRIIFERNLERQGKHDRNRRRIV